MISGSTLRFRRATPEAVKRLRRQVPTLTPLVAEMLVARGYDTPEAVHGFFHPSPEALHDPMLFQDMEKAVDLLRNALGDGQRVLIQGDYDCDGVCGTTLLMEALQEIGADVDYHVPDRFAEGYGLSMKAVERCRDEGFGLLLTVDCGSSSHNEIEAAKELGVTVIVTDHHHVPENPPQPHAFINPQRPDCPYPFKGICGTGVAYKLIQALRKQSGAEPAHFLDLVALATVADVVPLIDENRVLVQLGLQELGRSRREGLTALLEVSGRSGRDVVDAFTVGFTLGPRLNAAGRMEHAKHGVELMLSRSLAESRKLATHLDSLNEQRKEAERAIQAEIEERFARDPKRFQNGAIVEWGEGWHEGVIGITAGRLAEKYGVPTLVIATSGEKAKGSGRSPENVDLYQALHQCRSVFSKYGGHPRAGGFSLPAENLESLREKFNQAAQELRNGEAPVWLDGCLTLQQVTLDLVKELERMEPFGEANPKPNFLLEGVEILHQRLVGASGDHLQLEIQQVGERRRAIAFRQADYANQIKTQDYRYDLRCELGRDMFRGQEQLKIQVSGVVRPPCQERPERDLPVQDFRHLRGRRKALESWMEESPDHLAVCRDPDKAEQAYPDMAGRFFTYEDCPEGCRGLALLTPPEDLAQLEQLMTEVQPARLAVIFGMNEIERSLTQMRTRTWGRKQAVALWQMLRTLGPKEIESRILVREAAEKLSLDPTATAQIMAAFVQTEALRETDSGRLAIGQANGMKLEDTEAFKNQPVALENLLEVRAFFSGPNLGERLAQRWPCLVSRESVAV